MRPLNIAIKFATKFDNLLSWAKTILLRGWEEDPTQILIDEMTEAQKLAVARESNHLGVVATEKPAVWVIIPFRDKWDFTEACLGALVRQRHERFDMRLILVDNGSKSIETKDGLKSIMAQDFGFPVEVMYSDEEFNFSRLNNQAVKRFVSNERDWILFLNNDVFMIQDDAIERMVEFAQHHRRQLGALGCTLVYPDGTIQHLFAAPGVKIVAAHPLKKMGLRLSHSWFQAARPVAAVTGAALLCEAASFRSVGGFDEALAVQGQDIDLCLKFQKFGRVNWVVSKVVLTHAESTSRKSEFDRGEVEYFYKKWGDFALLNPFYSNRFSRLSERPLYRAILKQYPWSGIIP